MIQLIESALMDCKEQNIVSAMAADDLATEGARASAAMVLSDFWTHPALITMRVKFRNI